MGDAVDLGWKLAATLDGWGGSRLLDSYETERRPVHEQAMDEAVANYATVANQLARPGLEAEGLGGDATRREVGDTILTSKIREMRQLGVVKGYTYTGSPLVVADGTPAPPQSSMAYIPSARPGGVAPHLWLQDGTSLYDHFQPGFSLLVTDDNFHEGIGPLVATASRIGLPLSVIRPNDPRLRARYGAPLALIRPDQHVAWRGQELPADPVSLLNTLTGAA